jgi:glycosyltransferase involved in cell wall biosynthesis
MAAGVPVAAADTGGPATIITDKINGRLAVNGTAENFAEIAVEILKNPEACQALITHARKHVLKTYSVDRVCRDTLSVYQETLRSHREMRSYKPDKD